MLSYLIEVSYQVGGVDRVFRPSIVDPTSQDPFARAIEMAVNKHASKGETITAARAVFVEAR